MYIIEFAWTIAMESWKSLRLLFQYNTERESGIERDIKGGMVEGNDSKLVQFIWFSSPSMYLISCVRINRYTICVTFERGKKKRMNETTGIICTPVRCEIECNWSWNLYFINACWKIVIIALNGHITNSKIFCSNIVCV